jgi:MFS family permease
MSTEDLLAWGWRLPFLFRIVLVFLGLWIRLKIHESPKFVEMKETGAEAKLPLVLVFRQYPKEIFQAIGMGMAENGAFYIISTAS